MLVELPSGLVVTLRKFRVEDEDLLADPHAIKQGVAGSLLLNAVTESVQEAGPYQLKQDRLDWNEVLLGDRMTALLKNRIATWGKDMPTKQPCQNCKRPVEQDVDLSELPIKPLPESSREHVVVGTALKVTLPLAQKKVSFRLLRGKDEAGVQRLEKQKKSTLASSYLRYRTVDIEGVPEHSWTEFYRKLDSDDASFLRAAFDDADCGIDQEIEFSCAECHHVWDEDVKFRSDFLFPKYRKKRAEPG